MPSKRRPTTLSSWGATRPSGSTGAEGFEGKGPSQEPHHPTPSLQTSQVPEDGSIPNLLLIDEVPSHAQQLIQYLKAKGLQVELCPGVRDALHRLQKRAGCYDLVLVAISNPCRPWDLILHDLQEATHQSRRQRGPLFLCITRSRSLVQLRLMIEKMGARLAYER